MPVAELVEGVMLHAFEGKTPFSEEAPGKIAALREVHGLDLTAEDRHRLREDPS